MKQYYVKTRRILLAAALSVCSVCSSYAGIIPFLATYFGSQEVPPNASPAIGTISGFYDDDANTLYYMIMFGGLTSGATAAHFHAPGAPGVSAPVLLSHAGFPLTQTAGTYTAMDVLTPDQEAMLKAGLWYSNIHSSNFPGGEIRAQIVLGFPANLHFFKSMYSGKAEVPPNESRGTGIIAGVYDDIANRIYYGILFGGLGSNTTAAHFHAPGAPGVSAPVVIPHTGFPLGVQQGWYANTHLLTDLQETQLLDGLWYSNIHTTGYPAGEIRAQLMPKKEPPVPDNCVEITGLSASPCLLWPPNHKMKEVKVDWLAGENCPNFKGCELSVTSNEPVNGVGDGNTSPDWRIVDDHHVQLRAERAGNGNGRIYTITLTCKDDQGRQTVKTTTVRVPHDRRKGDMGDCPSDRRESGLAGTIAPNPGRGQFMLNIQTDNNDDRIQIKISNMQGRIVSVISNIRGGSQTVRIGDNLEAGVYFVKIMQGDETIQLKLVKVN